MTENTGKPPKNSENQPGSEPQRKHDLFSDPALARSLEEDPVARFLISNWKVLLVIIAALAGALYLRAQIKQTTEVRIAESSEAFDRARSSLMEYLEISRKSANKDGSGNPPSGADGDKEKSEKLLRAAKDSFSALKSGPEPYSKLADFYEELLGNEEKAVSPASQTGSEPALLKNSKIEDWRSIKDPAERLILELKDLAASRILLDTDSTYKDGVSRLLLLSKDAQYVRPSAIMVLLRVVDSVEDKNEVKKLASEIVRSYPDHAEKIEAELKRF